MTKHLIVGAVALTTGLAAYTLRGAGQTAAPEGAQPAAERR